jgi:hypothetical protein
MRPPIEKTKQNNSIQASPRLDKLDFFLTKTCFVLFCIFVASKSKKILPAPRKLGLNIQAPPLDKSWVSTNTVESDPNM